jgi:hypothetical protein
MADKFIYLNLLEYLSELQKYCTVPKIISRSVITHKPTTI